MVSDSQNVMYCREGGGWGGRRAADAGVGRSHPQQHPWNWHGRLQSGQGNRPVPWAVHAQTTPANPTAAGLPREVCLLAQWDDQGMQKPYQLCNFCTSIEQPPRNGKSVYMSACACHMLLGVWHVSHHGDVSGCHFASTRQSIFKMVMDLDSPSASSILPTLPKLL